MDFKNINNIDELIKEADAFSQDPQYGQGAANRLSLENPDSYQYDDTVDPEIADTEPDNKDNDYTNSQTDKSGSDTVSKFAQEDVQLLDGTTVEKGELLKWYYIVRANISIIQEILDKE